MLFKQCYTVSRLDIHSPQSLRISLDGPGAISLLIRSPTEKERENGAKTFNAQLDIIGEFVPSKKSLPVFTALIEGRRPPKGKKALSGDEMILREGPSEGLESYPNPFVAFVDNVCGKLSALGHAFVATLRWRYAQEGPPSPLRNFGLYCSNDGGDSWLPIPGRYSIQNVTPPHSVFMIQEADVSELHRLLSEGIEEPAYHELLREAKELEHTSPRSSVLLAVSAAEVAVKSTVIATMPKTAWLVENLPSPPLVKILSEYFPVLFEKGESFYDSNNKEGLLKTMEAAVFLRNQMVHKGTAPPSRDKVREILHGVQELLWICDYYSGY